MPSCQLFTQSGGIGLVSGAIFSGTPFPVGGIQLSLDAAAPAAIYVGLVTLSGVSAPTQGSGGVWSSGGMADGMKLGAGGTYFVPKVRLVSGVETIRLLVPAAASGGRLFWEFF